MTRFAPRFQRSEIDEIPAPGLYLTTISSADFRTSAHGNHMLQVVFILDGLSPPWDRVPDFFVLDANNARANAMARRRLVLLYRACGLDPQPDQPISPEDLVEARLQIKIEHACWDDSLDPRLRVVTYRSAAGLPSL